MYLRNWVNEMQHMDTSSPRNPETKLLADFAAAAAWRQSLRRLGKRLVVTNGCFDIMHRGHASYLHRARMLGDALLVAVNSDASVRSLKGPERPINDQLSRALLLASLESVDGVVVFDSLRADGILNAVEPDIYAKGGDISLATLPTEERECLSRFGTEVVFLPFVEGFSTTGIVQRLRNVAEPDVSDVCTN